MTGMAQNDHLSMTLLFFKRQGGRQRMKYAMITGASSGIGREFARQLARKG